jgi:FkbM family methyltransferase
MPVFTEHDTHSGQWRRPGAMMKHALLIRRVQNWPLFLMRRWRGRPETVLRTRRGGLSYVVPRGLAPAFRDVAVFDTYELEGMAAELGTSPIVVDVGANAGYFALYLLAQVPGARVYAYEPVPGNFAVLERNRAINPGIARNLDVFQKAVTGAPCDSIEIHVQAGKDHSMVASIHAQIVADATRAVKVGAISLAQIVESVPGKAIDLLKLDCEGAEYEIMFETPREALDRVRRIVMETHVRKGLAHTHEEMVAFLRARGYVIREMVQYPGSSYLIWARR